MHLKKLVTRNFRLLENFEIEFNPEVTIIIGPNYTGKSSVIEALIFLRDAALGGFGHAFRTREGFSRVSSWCDGKRTLVLDTTLADETGSQFSYDVQFDSAGLRGEQATVNSSLICTTKIQGVNQEQLVYFRNNDANFTINRNFDVALLPHRVPVLAPLVECFSSVVNVDPFRNVAYQSSVGTKEMIHATGADLPQVLHYHYNNDRERFDAFESTVRKVLPEVDIIETPLVPGGNAVTVRIRFQASRVKFELVSLSSGVKDVLILLAAAHFSPPGSLVLIEEPENHLHAAAQKALCSVIRELARTEQKQFVLTTHSEFILGQFDTAQSVFIERGDSGSQAIPLEKVDVYSVWQRLGIERSKLLEVLGRTRQVVVITESRNDAKILEVLAKDDHELSDSVLPARAEGGGWADIIQYAAQLRDALSRFRIPSAVFVLLDNDGERERKRESLVKHGFDDGTSHVWCEKEIESYLLFPGALVAISGKPRSEVETIIAQANCAGKERLHWVLRQLGIDGVPLDVIVTNACRNKTDEVPAEFTALVEKLRRLR